MIFTMLLLVTVGTSIALIPRADAHSPPQLLTTNAYIESLPKPVGVGQSTLIYMWLNRVYGYYPVENPGVIGYAAVNNGYRFRNYLLTITAPDGTNTTQTFPVIQDATSSQAVPFTPTVAGTYILTFNFPGQAYNSSGGDFNPNSVLVNDYYLPSSATANLTVQQAPIFEYPGTYPLPTEYWTRPIYGENPGLQSHLTGWEQVHLAMVASQSPITWAATAQYSMQATQ